MLQANTFERSLTAGVLSRFCVQSERRVNNLMLNAYGCLYHRLVLFRIAKKVLQRSAETFSIFDLIFCLITLDFETSVERIEMTAIVYGQVPLSLECGK